ncbi:MAG: hypothetical protein IT580_11990 [Verrucomicrobiales bacterium]|nr:hypothetical protein [Verrucomicrobiales bacterium]
MISYSAAEARVRVMLDPAIPQLTPLLVSHPGDGFAPEDPWFALLDPSAQGLAFSRRYGFVMDSMTDPLPEGTKLWLRRLSGDPEVGAYRYANTAPKAFEPIFGTAGSPAAMAWNGMMFHPTFTAPSGTNTYTATFDAYLADAASGVERPNTSTGAFTMQWTSVEDGRPSLTIGRKLIVSWVAESGRYVLESADSVPAGNWSEVGVAPVAVEGRIAVVLDPAASSKVYRLRRVP